MYLKNEGKDYFSNFYRSMYYDKNQYLITLDDGSFVFIDRCSFKNLKKGKITNSDLFLTLENKGVIITPKNARKVVVNLQRRYQFLLNGTSLHIVIPTSRCNLSCPYCFAEPQKLTDDKNLYDMSEETAKKTVKYIMDCPSQAVTIEFTGGEPTARFDLVKLMVEYAKNLNKHYRKDLQFTIVTNLTMMTEEIAKYLVENNVGICTSLDGPEIVNDSNRVIEGANNKKIGTYNLVEKWVNRINQMYEERGSSQRINALMTITRYSFDYYKEILDLYAKLQIYAVDIRAMMFIGKPTKVTSDPNQYSYDEFTKFYKNCLNYIDELNSKGIAMQDRMVELYKTKIHRNTPTFHVDYESPWGAGTGSLTYDPNGTIYACHESIGKDEFKLGNINTHSWRELFKTDEMGVTILSSMLESNPLCDKCVFKPYCGTSPIENLYSEKKLNFYPQKTMHHHETVFHAKNNFDAEIEKIFDK